MHHWYIIIFIFVKLDVPQCMYIYQPFYQIFFFYNKTYKSSTDLNFFWKKNGNDLKKNLNNNGQGKIKCTYKVVTSTLSFSLKE